MLFLAEPKKLRRWYWRPLGKRHLWGAGKFMGSVGHITLKAAKKYVENHHAKAHIRLESPPFMVGEDVNSFSNLT